METVNTLDECHRDLHDDRSGTRSQKCCTTYHGVVTPLPIQIESKNQVMPVQKVKMAAAAYRKP